ncbi:MAG: hypothetical protein IPN95_10880 [Bacteroidetes bacterium]|nr:hypothetical protein [Bacteroidota bacterium]MBP6722689.1 hypothetical protein [Bacteroidia bacterium]
MNQLLEKIKKIEALIAGAQTDGEKNAAISAKERILRNNPSLQIQSKPKEFSLSMPSNWHKKLLIAICRKYEVKPYRYYRQKYTTVMVRVDEAFMNQVLWKEFQQYSRLMEELVSEITDDLISKIHQHEDEDLIQGELN